MLQQVKPSTAGASNNLLGPHGPILGVGSNLTTNAENTIEFSGLTCLSKGKTWAKIGPSWVVGSANAKSKLDSH